jgi:hypothetical protein
LIITLSEGGLVATTPANPPDWRLVAGGSPMTEGRHYWEVELTAGEPGFAMVGAVLTALDHDESQPDSNDAFCGNGKQRADNQGQFTTGDRISVLLDLDAGWMRF